MAQAALSAGKRLARAIVGAARVEAAARAINRHRLLVVCYHGLRDEDAPIRHWLLLPRGEFARQVRHLASNYRCVGIDEGVAALRAGALQEPTACVTFDDGYRSNLTLALPVLHEHRVPATVYLATGLVGTAALVWTTQLELVFGSSSAPSVDLSALGLGVRALGEAGERARTGGLAVEALKRVPDDVRRTRLDELTRLLGDAAPLEAGPFALMAWPEVVELGATGLVTFGAHTVSHPILGRLADADVEREVADSIAAVGAHTTAVSRTFAYPNGRRIDFDRRAAAAARRAGAVAAVSTAEGLNGVSTDPYSLRRVVVGGDMAFDTFRRRITAASLRPS